MTDQPPDTPNSDVPARPWAWGDGPDSPRGSGVMTPPDPCPLPAIWSDTLMRRLDINNNGVVVVRGSCGLYPWTVEDVVETFPWHSWLLRAELFEIELDDVRACVVWASMTEAERREAMEAMR